MNPYILGIVGVGVVGMALEASVWMWYVYRTLRAIRDAQAELAQQNRTTAERVDTGLGKMAERVDTGLGKMTDIGGRLSQIAEQTTALAGQVQELSMAVHATPQSPGRQHTGPPAAALGAEAPPQEGRQDVPGERPTGRQGAPRNSLAVINVYDAKSTGGEAQREHIGRLAGRWETGEAFQVKQLQINGVLPRPTVLAIGEKLQLRADICQALKQSGRMDDQLFLQLTCDFSSEPLPVARPGQREPQQDWDLQLVPELSSDGSALQKSIAYDDRCSPLRLIIKASSTKDLGHA